MLPRSDAGEAFWGVNLSFRNSNSLQFAEHVTKEFASFPSQSN